MTDEGNSVITDESEAREFPEHFLKTHSIKGARKKSAEYRLKYNLGPPSPNDPNTTEDNLVELLVAFKHWFLFGERMVSVHMDEPGPQPI
jgi:hypothetical protein